MIVISLFFSSIFAAKPIDQPLLLPDKEIQYSTLTQIQILHIPTNVTTIVEDISKIEKLSVFLKTIKTNVDEETKNYSDSPNYHIYLVNSGHYPHPPIAVSEDVITFKDREFKMTPEEASSFFQLLDETRK